MIREIFNNLRSTASANERKEIMSNLLQSDKRELILQIFEDCYGPTKYNLSSDRITEHSTIFDNSTLTIDKDYHVFHEMLEKLAKRELTGNAALEYADQVFARFVNEDRPYLSMILDKNLKVGFSLEQVNKLLGKKKKEFEVSLAYNLDDVKGVDPIDGTYFASRKLDGCVSGDTLITMADGTRLPIKYIVENEITGKVLSYNTKTGKLEKDDICGHLKNGIDVNQKENTHQWYEIELEDGRKIKLTGNHKVYLPDLNCYRRVDELQGNENLLVI